MLNILILYYSRYGQVAQMEPKTSVQNLFWTPLLHHGMLLVGLPNLN